MKSIAKVLPISVLTLFSALTVHTSVKAENLTNKGVEFNQPPHLVEVTTIDQAALQTGRYHFVIHVPNTAGAALQAIVINPVDRAEQIDFDHNSSVAHRGTADANGANIDLVSIGGEAENPEDVWVVFEEPIAPGETVTVTLATNRNPTAGVYLFGVTAYPDRNDSVGQFLGYGRIQIYGY